MAFYNVPAVSIAVIDDYQIDWVRAYGYADKEAKVKATTRSLRGKRRKKPLTYTQLARSTSKLAKIEEKLFFILYFFKNGQIQQSLAAQFEMNQGHISRYIKVLYLLLLKSIKDLIYSLPKRCQSRLDCFDIDKKRTRNKD